MAEHGRTLVGSGAGRLIQEASLRGVPGRVVLAAGGLIAALLPGITALILVLAARATLRLRAVVAVLVVALGAASYVYEPHGKAAGTLILALAVAAAAVALSGPLVAAPLAGAAALIGGVFLPSLVARGGSSYPGECRTTSHQALFGHPRGVHALKVLVLLCGGDTPSPTPPGWWCGAEGRNREPPRGAPAGTADAEWARPSWTGESPAARRLRRETAGTGFRTPTGLLDRFGTRPAPTKARRTFAAT